MAVVLDDFFKGREGHRKHPGFIELCDRIAGREVELRFVYGDAFEVDDVHGFWLPDCCWDPVNFRVVDARLSDVKIRKVVTSCTTWANESPYGGLPSLADAELARRLAEREARQRWESHADQHFCDNPECRLHGVVTRHDDWQWMTELRREIVPSPLPPSFYDGDAPCDLTMETRYVSRRPWARGDGSRFWLCDDCSRASEMTATSRDFDNGRAQGLADARKRVGDLIVNMPSRVPGMTEALLDLMRSLRGGR